MTNLTLSRIKNLLQEHKGLLIVILGIFFVGLILLFLTFPKKPPVVPRLKFQRATNVFLKPGHVTVSFQKETLNKLPVYQIEWPTFDQAAAVGLAQKLEIQNPPQVLEEKGRGKLFFFQQNDLQLTVSQTTISFKKPPPQEGAGIALAPNEAFFKAKDYLAALGWWDDRYLFDEKSTKYYRSAGPMLVEERDPTKSDVIDINFKTEVGGFSWFGQDPDAPLLTVRLTSLGNIILLTLQGLPQIKTAEIYPLKSFDEAKKLVEGGRGTVMRVFIEGEGSLSPPAYNVSSFNLTDVDIAYFLPEANTKTLQPIFVFRGAANLLDGRWVDAVVYLQAVKSNSIKF